MSKVFKGECVIVESRCQSLNPGTGKYENEGISGSVSTGDLMTARCEKMIWRARMDANKIIVEAENLSKAMIEQTLEKIKTDHEAAVEEGYNEGLAKGEAVGLEMIRAQLDEIRGLIEEIERQKAQILQVHEEGLKEFSLMLTRKIIDSEMRAGDKAFLSLYKKAVQDLHTQDWVKLTVSSAEEEFATSNAEVLRQMVRGAKNIKISVIENALPGTCIVETPHSIADAGVETQIACLRDTFDGVDLLD